MDLRKKIRTSSYHEIKVPMGEPYSVEDKDGNEKTEYYESDQYTLADIVSRVKSLGIPDSEFDKVNIFVSFYYSEPSIKIEYRKPKTPKRYHSFIFQKCILSCNRKSLEQSFFEKGKYF